ncbi:substrate-binding domain-containing protein [Youxingia wuxianensis]|uniref:Substrate-binding domain-containing protein n=1 Tax=Youxingia wuxianensis TaxID=2763678 RepID=A0A926ES29_9FIRM|nr:substrate-binding domain-containing protein [Youxingia wuxianensis]MBC8585469.1 substrate-binding domain-containing protein [Youxingia wuxianensis]
MKRVVSVLLVAMLALSVFAGCSSTDASTPSTSDTPAAPSQEQVSSQEQAPSQEDASSDFDTAAEIAVISREPGSGTRGAFVELFGIEEKDADGNKVDHTTEEADIASKTDVMLTNVAGNPAAIGYVSLGSLNDTVKALNIDGVEATAENVKSGTYKVSRPFNIATKGEATGLAKDFIDFIMSKEGQEVVSDGYIPVNDAAQAYAGSKPEGKIVVAGSSSVSPIMQKLKEAYIAVNPAATIEIQTSDSTAGMTATLEGTCDIGMASRELKESEAAELTATAIANDGIAVIVNAANPAGEMTSEQVKSIFTGETLVWSDIIK